MEYFCHVTCMVYSGINNGLLTLNMGLAKKVVKSNMVWAFESKKIKGCILSSMQPMLQMSKALEQ
jgi:hypothetical protein